MKLIVGLGNPGKEYETTRHNVGFWVLDNFLGDVKWKKNSDAFVYERKIGREKIVFIKPLSYMNLSGIVVKKYMKYYKIEIEKLLIIQDDLDLEIGKYKCKNNSSSGGHNGIKSIIDNLNSTSFSRIKIGISKSNELDAKDHVLGKFSREEIRNIQGILIEIDDLILDFIKKSSNQGEWWSHLLIKYLILVKSTITTD